MSIYWTYSGDLSGQFWEITVPDPQFFRRCNLPRVLSQINRWSGHTNRPYSVAEHSLFVAALLPADLVAAALLHDAGEAITGDIARPWLELIGRNSPLFARLHVEWHEAALAAWGVELQPGDRKCIALADNVAAFCEARALVGRNPHFSEFCSMTVPSEPPQVPGLNSFNFQHERPIYWERLYGEAVAIASVNPAAALNSYLRCWRDVSGLNDLSAWREYLEPEFKRMRSV